MTLNINGRDVPAVGSLLDAVLASGAEIPHLCKDDNLAPIGACRTCLVEADGRVVAACSLPSQDVERVETHSERVVALRRGVLELTAAMQSRASDEELGGPCSGTASGAYEQGGIRPKAFGVRTEAAGDGSSEFFAFHEDQCILCGRCVTACQDLQHIGAIGLAGKGRETRITPGAGVSFRESVCTSCGSCVAACPTIALRPKAGRPHA